MDQKFVLLRRHGCTDGLRDEQIREIADASELIQLPSDSVLHHSGDPLNSVYLILQGRLRQTISDSGGNEVLRNFLGRGAQFGVLAAAQLEPIPVSVVAVEPLTVLKLSYRKFLKINQRIPRFLVNMIQLVGNMMKQNLKMDRSRPKANVVAVIHDSPGSRQLTRKLIERLRELGEQPCVISDDAAWNSQSDTPHLLMVEDGRWLDETAVRAQIAKWSARERVFVDFSADIPLERLVRSVTVADLVLVCIRPEDWQRSSVELKKLVTKEPEWREKLKLVWIIEDATRNPPPIDQLGELVSYDFKVSFSDPPENYGRVLNHGVERVVHELRGVRLGIALGGGAARGMAHLGVLKTLEEHGIIVDMVAGTSAGAMTGTVYASGMDIDYAVRQFVNDLTPSWFFRRLPHGGYWYLLYKYRREQFDPMLRKYLSDLDLQQLPIPMKTITVDLVSGEPKIRESGDAVRSIIESINLPGLAAPICHNGQALVDGGLVNNVPADVLVEKGCNFVIAVSVTAHLEREFARIRPDSPGPKYKSPSVLQTIMRGYLVQSVNMNSVGVQPADVIIEPDVTSFDLSEFTRTDELAAVGAETTEKAIADIRTSLAEIDRKLFLPK